MRPPKVSKGVLLTWVEPIPGGGHHRITARVDAVGYALKLRVEKVEPENTGGLYAGKHIVRQYSNIYPRLVHHIAKQRMKAAAAAKTFRGYCRIAFCRAAALKRPTLSPPSSGPDYQG